MTKLISFRNERCDWVKNPSARSPHRSKLQTIFSPAKRARPKNLEKVTSCKNRWEEKSKGPVWKQRHADRGWGQCPWRFFHPRRYAADYGVSYLRHRCCRALVRLLFALCGLGEFLFIDHTRSSSLICFSNIHVFIFHQNWPQILVAR